MSVKNRVKELRQVRAGDLRTDPRNWRRHPATQRKALADILDSVGYADAVIARETADGLTLIDGHLRADLDADQVIPVLVTDLDETEAGQVLATLDPLAAMAERDDDAITNLLNGIKAHSSELMQQLMDDIHEIPAPMPPGNPDETPEPPEEPITRRGDVWLLGNHRLMCGDTSDADDVARLLDGAKPRLMVTDPPYASGGFQEAGKPRGSKGTNAAYMPIINDKLSTRGYIALLTKVLEHYDGEFIYIFTDWRMWVYLYDVAESKGYAVRSMIVWNKVTPALGVGWRSQHELILCGMAAHATWGGHEGGQGNVVTLGRVANVHHATEKPVALLETILDTNPPVDDVYDPFVGSGTTIIAAERQGRACYAMEIEPRYVDMSVKRWEDYTGGKAERIPA